MARLWVPLDVNFQDDDSIIDVSLAGELLYVRSLALGKRLGTDGRIRRSHLRRLCDKANEHPDDLAVELVDAGLWTIEHEADGIPSVFKIAAWDRWNDPVDEENRVRAGKSRGGKLGNHRKYGHPGALDDCPKCYPDPSDTESDTDRWSDSLTDRSRSHSRETVETEKNPPVVPPSRGKRPLPPDWEPNDTHQRLATDHDRDLQREAQAFRDYCQAHDRRYKDHDAAFRQWLRNDQYRSPPNGQQPRLTAAEQRTQRNRETRARVLADLEAKGLP